MMHKKTDMCLDYEIEELKSQNELILYWRDVLACAYITLMNHISTIWILVMNTLNKAIQIGNPVVKNRLL